MHTVSYSALIRNEPAALECLTNAAETAGFLALDIDGDEGELLKGDIDFINALSEKVFDMPQQTKHDYDFKKLGRFRTTGFKPMGIEEGARKGQPDGFELFMLPRNELYLSNLKGRLNCPPFVMSHVKALEDAVSRYESLSQLILSRLAEGLQMDDNLLLDAHDPEAQSVTNLGLIKYPPQPVSSSNFGHIAHTDVGTLTILSSTERGLQVLDAKTQDWVFVDHSPSQVFVQFGDCLKFLSRGKVVPSLHRVVPSDTKPQATKYTIAYFLRPAEKAAIVADDGTQWLYEDYHCRKFDAFARPLGPPRPDGEDDLISIRKLVASRQNQAVVA